MKNKKWPLIIIGIIVLFAAAYYGPVIYGTLNSGTIPPPPETPIPRPSDSYPSDESTYMPIEEPMLDPYAGATMGEQNALDTANAYLNISAFSYSGLVDQLLFEGYTRSEATYAADNCGADWKEQAALKAAEYLAVSSFSRQGLIDQLEFEGFMTSQAEYGVKQNGY